ncbi:hypothetical protein Tco_0218690 [Tanacetum coccineum]
MKPQLNRGKSSARAYVYKLWLIRRSLDGFQYHHRCEKQKIINLCFADDLFIFARGIVKLANVGLDTLEEFKQSSGLEVTLPVKYLRVPIISSQLLYRGCKASAYILHARIILDIKQSMRGFLWCQGGTKKGMAKVAWDTICKPKLEEGLGMDSVLPRCEDVVDFLIPMFKGRFARSIISRALS